MFDRRFARTGGFILGLMTSYIDLLSSSYSSYLDSIKLVFHCRFIASHTVFTAASWEIQWKDSPPDSLKAH